SPIQGNVRIETRTFWSKSRSHLWTPPVVPRVLLIAFNVCTSFPKHREETALFPLTLALSLGEREQLSSRCERSSGSGFICSRPMVLPLPEGEGRGEGGDDTRTKRRALTGFGA